MVRKTGQSPFKEVRLRCTLGLFSVWMKRSGNIEEGLQLVTIAALGYDEDKRTVTFERIKAKLTNNNNTLSRLVDVISNTPNYGEYPADIRGSQRLHNHLYVRGFSRCMTLCSGRVCKSTWRW